MRQEEGEATNLRLAQKSTKLTRKSIKRKMAKLVININIMTFSGEKERARKRGEIGDRIERKKKQ